MYVCGIYQLHYTFCFGKFTSPSLAVVRRIKSLPEYKPILLLLTSVVGRMFWMHRRREPEPHTVANGSPPSG